MSLSLPNPEEKRSNQPSGHNQVPEPLAAYNFHGTPYAYEVRKSELLQAIKSEHISTASRISAARYFVRLADRAVTVGREEGIVARDYLATVYMIAGQCNDALAVTEDSLRRLARMDADIQRSDASVKTQLAAQTLLTRGGAFYGLGYTQSALVSWSRGIDFLTQHVRTLPSLVANSLSGEIERIARFRELQGILEDFVGLIPELKPRVKVQSHLTSLINRVEGCSNTLIGGVFPKFYGIEQALTFTPNIEYIPFTVAYLQIHAAIHGFRGEQRLEDQLLCRALSFAIESLPESDDYRSKIAINLLTSRMNRRAYGLASEVLVDSILRLSSAPSPLSHFLVDQYRNVISRLDSADLAYVLAQTKSCLCSRELSLALPLVSAIFRRSLILKNAPLAGDCFTSFNDIVPRFPIKGGRLAPFQAEWFAGSLSWARVQSSHQGRIVIDKSIRQDMRTLILLGKSDWKGLASKTTTLCHAGYSLIKVYLNAEFVEKALDTADKVLEALIESEEDWLIEVRSRHKLSKFIQTIPLYDTSSRCKLYEGLFHFHLAPFLAPFGYRHPQDYRKISAHLRGTIELYHHLMGDLILDREKRQYLTSKLVEALWNSISLAAPPERALPTGDLKARKSCIQQFIKLSQNLSGFNESRMDRAFDWLVSAQRELAYRRRSEQ